MLLHLFVQKLWEFNMQEWILWLVSSITILGSVLNVKKMSSCFVVWTFCNIFWLVFDIWNKAYARAILDVVNLATSVWGLVSWIKPSPKSSSESSTVDN